MSFAPLQEKIRKLKSPLAARLWGAVAPDAAQCAAHLGLLEAVAGVVPAVVVETAWYEAAGFSALRDTLAAARALGFFVIADRRGGEQGDAARAAAERWLCTLGVDALTVSPYCGSAGLLPALEVARAAGKGLFVLGKTGGELQDMVAGDRQVYTVVGDLTERLAGSGDGYSPAGLVVAAACATESRALRRRLERTFLLLTGYGAPDAGPQEIAGGFDHFGRGALAADCGVLLRTLQTDGAAAVKETALSMRDALKPYVTIV